MSRKCQTCRVEVADFKDHVKDVWHTYNCKRETVGLPPVSLEDFRAKQEALIVVAEERKEYRCCNKHYKSEETYRNHLNSSKHARSKEGIEEAKRHSEEAVEDSEDEDEWETENEEEDEEEVVMDIDEEKEDEEDKEEEEDEPLEAGACLFCSHQAGSTAESLAHMHSKHQFQLPLPEFIADLEGLLEHLRTLVGRFHACVQCDKQFYDRLAARNHMGDAGHVQVSLEGGLVAPFYLEVPRAMTGLDDGGAEALLPNGRLLGHRSLWRFFRQNLTGLHEGEGPLAVTSGAEKARQSLCHLGQSRGVLAASRPGLVSRQDRKMQTKEARYRQYRASKYSNFQAHYRHQILM